MPKWKLRPARLVAEKSPSPARYVLVEGARSAEPPTSVATTGARALSTFPDAARVAIVSRGVNAGSAASHPAGSSPASAARHCAATSGYADAKARTRACHAVSSAAPRITHASACSRAASGTRNVSCSGQP